MSQPRNLKAKYQWEIRQRHSLYLVGQRGELSLCVFFSHYIDSNYLHSHKFSLFGKYLQRQFIMSEPVGDPLNATDRGTV